MNYIEYSVIHKPTIDALEERMAVLLKDGYKPTGGLIVLDSGKGRRSYAQAVVWPGEGTDENETSLSDLDSKLDSLISAVEDLTDEIKKLRK